MALTGTGDPYYICVQDERIQRQVRDNFVTSCGTCPSASCASLDTSILTVSLFLLRRERAKDLMPSGQESLVIIVDYKSTTLRTNPSISVARKVGILSVDECIADQKSIQVLTILQQHYVETLGRALVVNLPVLLSFFYKGISPFLDPITRDKVRTLFARNYMR